MKSETYLQNSEPERAAIYLAPAAYGKDIDMKYALALCEEYIGNHDELRLMRIYRDEKVRIIRVCGDNGSRNPLGVSGNDAWQRLLKDTETSAVEVVVIYAARAVAPSISGLANLIRNYFIPYGIRFIDVEAQFDSESGDVGSYLKLKTSEYRSSLKRKPYKKRKKASL